MWHMTTMTMITTYQCLKCLSIEMRKKKLILSLEQKCIKAATLYHKPQNMKREK